MTTQTKDTSLTSLALPEKDLKVLNTFVVRGNQLKEEAVKLAIENSSDVLTANGIFKQTQLAEKEVEEKRKALVFPFNDIVKQVNTLAKECAQPAAEAKLIISQKLLAYNEKLEVERRAKADEERKALEAQRVKEEQERQARELEEKKKRDEEEARLKKIADEQKAKEQAIAQEQDALKKRQMEIDAENLRKEQELENQRIANEQAQRKIEDDKLEIERQKKQMEEDDRKKKEAEAQAVIDAANKVKGLRTGHKITLVDESKVPRQYMSVDLVKVRAAIKKGILIIDGLLIEDDKRIQ